MRGGGPHDVLACRRQSGVHGLPTARIYARPAAETLRLLGALLEGRWELRATCLVQLHEKPAGSRRRSWPGTSIGI